MKASDRLAALYREKEARGLLDVKFTLVDKANADFETVCAEVLAMEAAMPLAKPFSFGDDRRG